MAEQRIRRVRDPRPRKSKAQLEAEQTIARAQTRRAAEAEQARAALEQKIQATRERLYPNVPVESFTPQMEASALYGMFGPEGAGLPTETVQRMVEASGFNYRDTPQLGLGVHIVVDNVTVDGLPTDFNDVRKAVNEVMRWGADQVYELAKAYAAAYDQTRQTSLKGQEIHFPQRSFTLTHPKQQGEGPFIKDTVKLQVRESQGVTSFTVSVGAIAKYIILGTRPHLIFPSRETLVGTRVRWLLFPRWVGQKSSYQGGPGNRRLAGMSIGTRLQHPGVKPQPFVQWAARRYQGAIRARLRSAVSKTLGAKYKNVKVNVRLRGVAA